PTATAWWSGCGPWHRVGWTPRSTRSAGRRSTPPWRWSRTPAGSSPWSTRRPPPGTGSSGSAVAARRRRWPDSPGSPPPGRCESRSGGASRWPGRPRPTGRWRPATSAARSCSPLIDVGGEVLAGEGGAGRHEVGRCALEDDPAAVVAGAGAEVDDPVGVRHHRLVMFDHDHRGAGDDQPVEQVEWLLHVGEVQAGGGLVEDVDAAGLAHAGRQLEPLPLAPGERGERLAERKIAQP